MPRHCNSVTSPFPKGEGRVRVALAAWSDPHLSPLGAPPGRDPEGDAELCAGHALPNLQTRATFG